MNGIAKVRSAPGHGNIASMEPQAMGILQEFNSRLEQAAEFAVCVSSDLRALRGRLFGLSEGETACGAPTPAPDGALSECNRALSALESELQTLRDITNALRCLA